MHHHIIVHFYSLPFNWEYLGSLVAPGCCKHELLLSRAIVMRFNITHYRYCWSHRDSPRQQPAELRDADHTFASGPGLVSFVYLRVALVFPSKPYTLTLKLTCDHSWSHRGTTDIVLWTMVHIQPWQCSRVDHCTQWQRCALIWLSFVELDIGAVYPPSTILGSAPVLAAHSGLSCPCQNSVYAMARLVKSSCFVISVDYYMFYRQMIASHKPVNYSL